MSFAQRQSQMAVKDLYPSRTEAEPFVLERADPVIHSPVDGPGPLTAGQRRSYQQDGFIVLEDVFSPAEVAALRAGAEELRVAPSRLDRETIVAEPGENGAVRSIFATHLQDKRFADLCADERLAGIARYLLNDDVYIHQARLNYKPAFKGREFYWHSDFETWHAEDGMPRMRALSMSVMLTDNHPQAGPTMFVPGSHRSFVSCVGATPDNNYRQSLRKQEIGVPDTENLKRLVAEGNIVAPAPRAGSVVIFECNVMHGSNGNITPLQRINAFFVFNAWSNRLIAPFAGTRPRPEFIAHRNVDTPLPVEADVATAPA